uniref:Choline kinase n=1 Tax=Kalanchoe fedtschenkoi TaxID=63787 RepID=A0A7N0UDV3_KALFE
MPPTSAIPLAFFSSAFNSPRFGLPTDPHHLRSRPQILPIFLRSHLHSYLTMAAGENSTKSKEGRLPKEAISLLESLASKWSDVTDSKALQVIPLKGAMTNEVYQIKWSTNTDEVSRNVLVRVYGEGVDIFFDRSNEIKMFEFMSRQGQGPRLLGRFPNGRLEEFIHARTLSASDLHDPEISSLIAAKLREFHDLDMPGSREVILWNRLRKWLGDAKRLCSENESDQHLLQTLDEEIHQLEKMLSGDQHRIGLCHNDLQYGNIMMDETTKSITFIDYEYASYGPIAFDIANHFCEMAADYHTDTPHILDFKKYPSLENRQKFLRIYLSSTGHQPTDAELSQLLEDVEKYTLASHIFWGLWGMISAHVNEIDFDYKEYARQRFERYWTQRDTLLGSFCHSPIVNGDESLNYQAPSTKKLAS